MRETKEVTDLWSFCVECGENPKVDEDGCCASCGNGAVGPAVITLGVEMHRLRSSPSSALAEKEKAEAALCRAREFISNAEYAQPGEAVRALLVVNDGAPCPRETRLRKVEEALVDLLNSADISWYENDAGHDWQAMVDNARAVLAEGRKP